MGDFELAKDKGLMGAERRTLVMTDDERRVTAYHEGGHALVALLEKDGDPVHKVTIIPRGRALGITQTLPTEDRYTITKKELIARITHMMGGRAAEEVVFEHFSTGAGNDLEQATSLAREMVCDYGMSEALGPVKYAGGGDPVFLGRDFGSHREHSEEKARQIDEEIRVLLSESYDGAKRHLIEHRGALDRIATALLERETLGREQLELLLANRALPPAPAPVESKRSRKPESEADRTEPERPLGGNGIPHPEPIPG